MTLSAETLKQLGFDSLAVAAAPAALALAWLAAAPILGDVAGALAMVLGVASLLALLALVFLLLVRWQVDADGLKQQAVQPAQGGWAVYAPLTVMLLLVLAASLVPGQTWMMVIWWLVSGVQLAFTAWLLRASKGQARSWWGQTPAPWLAATTHAAAPLAGVPLGLVTASWVHVVIALFLGIFLVAGRLAMHLSMAAAGNTALPARFVQLAPAAALGCALLSMDGASWLPWLCWLVAVLALVDAARFFRRILAQPFSIAFWAFGLPVALLALLTIELTAHWPALQFVAMMVLALATLVLVLLGMASRKGLREGTLLQPAVPASMTFNKTRRS